MVKTEKQSALDGATSVTVVSLVLIMTTQASASTYFFGVVYYM